MRFNRGGWRFWRAGARASGLQTDAEEEAGDGENELEKIRATSVHEDLQEREHGDDNEGDEQGVGQPDDSNGDEGNSRIGIGELGHVAKLSVCLTVLTGVCLAGLVIIGTGSADFKHAGVGAAGYGAAFAFSYRLWAKRPVKRLSPWRVWSMVLADTRIVLIVIAVVTAWWDLGGAWPAAAPALLVGGACVGAVADGCVLALLAAGRGCGLGGALRMLCADISNDGRVA